MADAWDKFCEFSHFMKKSDQTMSNFIAEWENSYHKMKKVECVYSDLILAFKLLQASKLNEIETKLVLTGVNYAEGKRDKNLLQQVKNSLKKFKGCPVGMDYKRAVQPSDSLVSEMEDVFISKGWKPPKNVEDREVCHRNERIIRLRFQGVYLQTDFNINNPITKEERMH